MGARTAPLVLLLLACLPSASSLTSDQVVPPDDNLVRIGNESYYACSTAADCTKMIGHQRQSCYTFDLKNQSWNGSDASSAKYKLCACHALYGDKQLASHHPDPMCFTARCMYGPNACWARTGVTYWMYIGASIALFLFFALFLMCLYLLVGMCRAHDGSNGGKSLLRTAAGTSTLFSMASLVFLMVWAASYIVVPATGSSDYSSFVGFPIGIGLAAPCAGAAFLCVALMWYRIAAASKAMRALDAKMGKKLLTFTWVYCVLFFLACIVLFGALRYNSFGALAALAFLLVLAGVILYGSHKLVTVLHDPSEGKKKSPRVSRIIYVSRQIAGALLVFGVFNVTYAIIYIMGVRSDSLAALGISAIMIMLYSLVACFFVLLNYIRKSTQTARGVATGVADATSIGTGAVTSGPGSGILTMGESTESPRGTNSFKGNLVSSSSGGSGGGGGGGSGNKVAPAPVETGAPPEPEKE